MARPTGLTRTTKDNSAKHPQQRDEWNEGKKIGRPKQEFVTITGYDENGVAHVVSKYWRKVGAEAKPDSSGGVS